MRIGFRSIITRIISIFILFAILISISGCSNGKLNNSSTGESSHGNSDIRVHFIDVGQADCILIQQGDSVMLVDAGNNEDGDKIVKYIEELGIKKIEYVIGTHPHEDHIGGMDRVIDMFDIGKIYMPKVTSTTKTFEDVLQSVKNKNLKITKPEPGSKFMIGAAECTILAPNSSKYKEINNYSIVLRIVYKNVSFLLLGDAEELSEKEMIKAGYDLSAQVLKLGHHGSDSSTSKEFLNAVNPQYAVISVGKDNNYGHPAKSTMDRLKAKGIKVYRTDESGTIICTSNGEEIKFNVSPGSYSYPGKK